MSDICYDGGTNYPNDLSRCAKDLIFNANSMRITAIHDVEGNADGDKHMQQKWDIY